MQKHPSQEHDVIIVGGGLSGLSAALHLEQAGKRVALFEASDQFGGRVATEEHKGFLLDRGFQILLPSYPEAKNIFDYGALHLRYFRRGARVYLNNRWELLPDPFDDPWRGFRAAFLPFGTLKDKFQLAGITMKASRGLLQGDRNCSTLEYLQGAGLSELVIERFLLPFFRGVFLEEDLSRPSTDFAFYFSMFAQGGGALPANGMRALPNSLVQRISSNSLYPNKRVTRVNSNSIELESGEQHFANRIILAVEEHALSHLLGAPTPPQTTKSRGTLCLYFQGPRSALAIPPYLHLVPQSSSGITNIAPLSAVAPEYSPAHLSLLSVSLNDSSGRERSTDDIAKAASNVRCELIELFGPPFRQAEFLRGFSIPHALPSNRSKELRSSLPENFLLAGDIATQGSINGALLAGRLAAERCEPGS